MIVATQRDEKLKKLLLLVLILLMVVLPNAAFAEEPEVGSAADNACNEGGSMEGKCDTDWAWRCGWHLARWEAAGGWSGTYPMIIDCINILPPPSPSTNPAQAIILVATCQVQGQSYFDNYVYTIPVDVWNGVSRGIDDRTIVGNIYWNINNWLEGIPEVGSLEGVWSAQYGFGNGAANINCPGSEPTVPTIPVPRS